MKNYKALCGKIHFQSHFQALHIFSPSSAYIQQHEHSQQESTKENKILGKSGLRWFMDKGIKLQFYFYYNITENASIKVFVETG